MTTRIDTVQLIGDMEKVAAQLTQLVTDMKGAAAQVLSDKTFAKVVSNFPDIAESAKMARFEIAQPDMRMRRIGGVGLEAARFVNPATSLNAVQLITDVKNAVSEILKKRIEEVAGFSERQLKAIAKQAELVTKGIATGEITEETREFFLDGLQDMAENFIRTLRDIGNIVIEQLVNAIFDVLRKAIEAAIPVL